MEKMMIENFGIFRTQQLMQQGLEKLKQLKRRYQQVIVQDKGSRYNLDLIRVLELGLMLELAEVIAVGAIARKESRGAHFREDFPKMDNDHFLKHTIVRRDDHGNPALSYKDVIVEDIEPLKEIKY
ncbi:MAG: hypothetical protein SCK70_10905 [bacterium]|nr:hypothetical protein [bacterium]